MSIETAIGAINARVRAFTRVDCDAFARARVGRPPSACVAQARQLAAYLAVVELEIAGADYAQAAGVSPQSVSDAIRAIEERREDPALDAAIDVLAADLGRTMSMGVAA